MSLKLFVVLTRALEAIEKHVTADIKNQGINLTEFSVLELLYHKGEQPIQKIGQKILLSSSSMTYVIDQLEKKQWLTRQACPKDRRVTYAVITPAGKELMDGIFPKHVEAIHHIMGGLNTDEKELMIEQLKKLGYHAESL
ncbi:MarR family winged helix-turn-helix transcriptional regulator [Lentibacillus saliphilus]|uniref:MarR family winged helix-turn-helix transcriptional regulator n=1 Tax=Lentibacillus saliphilus TaxID=2737028 RepID=UPI001C30CA7E|nr:MarR family transcriptional regulator [Lentibacillus saliphilus]